MKPEQDLNSMADTDDLVIQARSDRDAFGRLYDEFYPGVLSYCLRRLFDRSMAEDVTSEIFLRIAVKVPRFQGTSRDDFRCWLYRIATNEINACLRKSGRRKVLLEKAVRQKGLIVEEIRKSNQVENIYNQLDWPVVYEALLQLKQREQSIITLRFFEGFTHEEISQTLNLRPGTVRVALGRALTKLRRLLDVPSLQESVASKSSLL